MDYRSAAQGAHQVAAAAASGGDAAGLSSVVRQAAEVFTTRRGWRDPHHPGRAGLPRCRLHHVGARARHPRKRVAELGDGRAQLAIIGFFIIVGAFYVKPENWVPFAPNGFRGISSAAAIIFFAYIGFDAVSTAAEETKNRSATCPSR